MARTRRRRRRDDITGPFGLPGQPLPKAADLPSGTAALNVPGRGTTVFTEPGIERGDVGSRARTMREEAARRQAIRSFDAATRQPAGVAPAVAPVAPVAAQAAARAPQPAPAPGALGQLMKSGIDGGGNG